MRVEREMPARTAVHSGPARCDPPWMRWTLTAFVVAAVGVLVVIPVVSVFAGALSGGVGVYLHNLVDDPDTISSLMLTLTVVPMSVVTNLVFGIAAAWSVSRFRFPGRALLITLIDLPFSISPVVAGLMFVLIFGRESRLGAVVTREGYAVMPYVVAAAAGAVAAGTCFLLRRDRREARGRLPLHRVPVAIGVGVAAFGVAVLVQRHFHAWPEHAPFRILFATPGLILATTFVTCPFIARELIPLMEALGPEEELASISLGANGWQTFWHITLPNVKWGLLYGIILCNARAMGEFGAVYVVSGHIAGRTDTMPLRIEKLFQQYNMPGSFAVASVLTLVAILTLVVKHQLERKLPIAPAARTRAES